MRLQSICKIYQHGYLKNRIKRSLHSTTTCDDLQLLKKLLKEKKGVTPIQVLSMPGVARLSRLDGNVRNIRPRYSFVPRELFLELFQLQKYEFLPFATLRYRLRNDKSEQRSTSYSFYVRHVLFYSQPSFYSFLKYLEKVETFELVKNCNQTTRVLTISTSRLLSRSSKRQREKTIRSIIPRRRET